MGVTFDFHEKTKTGNKKSDFAKKCARIEHKK